MAKYEDETGALVSKVYKPNLPSRALIVEEDTQYA